MTAYDGTPTLAVSACVLPAGCTAGAFSSSATAASGGNYTNNTLSYGEVGVVALQLTDTSYANVDSADTTLAARTFGSAAGNVGRFVPDSLTAAVTTSGQFATANGACMAAGQGATFLGQGFGWSSVPQVTVTARNAAGVITSYWSGALMKLLPASATPTLVVASAGSATLANSYGAITVTDLGAGSARLDANATDRFLLDVAVGTYQASTTPSWTWSLAVSDASEAATSGNPTLAASGSQVGVGFSAGAQFHSGRLSLSPGHGDARAGVRALAQLQRYTSAGWVTMTEDRGCITVQPQHLGVAAPVGVFTTSAGVCAAPQTVAVTSAGGRAWLSLPATPGASPGRLTLNLAGPAATGNSCAAVGTTQAIVSMGLPYLMGGASSTGPAALATWGAPNRDAVLRRETW